MKSLVAREITDEKLKKNLQEGDTIHFPKLNMGGATDYVPGEDISISDYSAADETLTVDERKVVPHRQDDVDELQMNYSARAELQKRSAYFLKDEIDKDVFAEVTNAGQLMLSDYSMSDFSGLVSDTTGFSVSSGNIVQIFSSARKGLRDKDVEEAGDFFAVITTGMAEVLERTAADSGFRVADTTLKNGFAGDFMGFDVYVSNNVKSVSGTVTADMPVFGKKGAISLVVQQAPKVELKEEPRQLASNIFVWTVYGAKTFSQKVDQFLAGSVSV